MRLILLVSILLIACSSELDVVSGPFVIKEGVTYDQSTNKPITGVIQEFYDDGQLKISATYRDGIRNGIKETFYDNGQLESRITLRAGLGHGVWEKFTRVGSIDARYNLVNGQFHGIQEQFFPNGSVSLRNEMDMTKWLTREIFYENGNISSKASMINEEPNGVVEYFHENGKLKARVEFIEGVRSGLNERYSDQGILWLAGELLNNKRQGIYTEYDVLDGEINNSWECDFDMYVKGSYKSLRKTPISWSQRILSKSKEDIWLLCWSSANSLG